MARADRATQMLWRWRKLFIFSRPPREEIFECEYDFITVTIGKSAWQWSPQSSISCNSVISIGRGSFSAARRALSCDRYGRDGHPADRAVANPPCIRKLVNAC